MLLKMPTSGDVLCADFNFSWTEYTDTMSYRIDFDVNDRVLFLSEDRLGRSEYTVSLFHIRTESKHTFIWHKGFDGSFMSNFSLVKE